jgi:hypothetical protein
MRFTASTNVKKIAQSAGWQNVDRRGIEATAGSQIRAICDENMLRFHQSNSNPVGKLKPMETAMLDINGALNLLKAGHSIERPGSNMRGTSYFVKNENGRESLFVRQTRLNSSEAIEEPTAFDWDDLTATTWQAVE